MPLIHRAWRYIFYHASGLNFYSYSFGYRIDSIDEYAFYVFRIRTHFILQYRRIDRWYDMWRKPCTPHTLLERSRCLFACFHLLQFLWLVDPFLFHFFLFFFLLPFSVLFCFFSARCGSHLKRIFLWYKSKLSTFSY